MTIFQKIIFFSKFKIETNLETQQNALKNCLFCLNGFRAFLNPISRIFLSKNLVILVPPLHQVLAVGEGSAADRVARVPFTYGAEHWCLTPRGLVVLRRNDDVEFHPYKLGEETG